VSLQWLKRRYLISDVGPIEYYGRFLMWIDAGHNRDSLFVLNFPLPEQISGVATAILLPINFLMAVVTDQQEVTHVIEETDVVL
jgi:hypothetical protein